MLAENSPSWLRLPTALQPGAVAFAILFAVESVARASILSVVPIQALDLIGDEQRLSIFYFVVGGIGMCATLCAPILFQRLPRRFVYTLGAVLLIVACALFASHTLLGQAGGMLVRILGGSTLAISLNLYIMEYIPKHGLVQSESLRLTLATFAWTFGPTFGVWLYVEYGVVAPFVWSAAWVLILIALFWFLRLSGNAVIRPGKLRPVNPFTNIRRFVAQPRLRLGWLIAFGRSCYWMTFYIYMPVLMVITGQGKIAGGIVISIGNALLVFSIAWGRLGTRIGVRAVVVFAFVAASIAGFVAGYFGEEQPWITALLILAGVNFAVALDAVGSVPYLRAVHSYERPQMTAVYRTNLDISELLPPFVYSFILAFTGLGGVFVTLGAFMAVCAWLSWKHLPRSM